MVVAHDYACPDRQTAIRKPASFHNGGIPPRGGGRGLEIPLPGPRYTSKKEYLATHRTSPAFSAFKKASKDSGITVEMDGRSYVETDIGFM